MGLLMLDLDGVSLTDEEKLLIQRPGVGGIILFTRNYESRQQLRQLICQIREFRSDLLIAVDHEGGRVQRFRSEFTRIPPMACLGRAFTENPDKALDDAREIAWLMAMELRVEGVDISFAPVLDVDVGCSTVIGDRSFSCDPNVVSQLSGAFIQGMTEAGMASTGKHFPGHGAVAADSHVAIPVDSRNLEEINASDLVPFRALIPGNLSAVMPAHVIYEKVDSKPAGFSLYWIQNVLRTSLSFDGVVFSDDLTMQGASVAGSYTERAKAALTAGCTMILVCNNREGAKEVLDAFDLALDDPHNPLSGVDISGCETKNKKMYMKACAMSWDALQVDKRWLKAKELALTLSELH